MSDPEISWFHCGRCGSLFQSPVGDMDDRTCSCCGSRPDTGLSAPPVPGNSPATAGNIKGTPNPVPERKRKDDNPATRNERMLFKIIIGWSAVLGLIILGAQYLWNEESPDKQPAAPAANTQTKPLPTQEEVALLNDAIPHCSQTFSQYLTAATQEEKSQFIHSASSAVRSMARFYNLSPIERIDPADISLSEYHVLNTPDGRCIETLWTTKNGRKLDAVFRKQDDEWKLDWHHFIRYSEQPWALFLAASGEQEAEFRLLARERLAQERKDAKDISLVLYAPRFSAPGETGYQSPEFNVMRDTADGKLLDAAFHQLRNGKSIYQSMLPNLDPVDMIRIRARIRRVEVNGVKQFTITRVIACHWYEINDPGVTPLETSGTNAPGDRKKTPENGLNTAPK